MSRSPNTPFVPKSGHMRLVNGLWQRHMASMGVLLLVGSLCITPLDALKTATAAQTEAYSLISSGVTTALTTADLKPSQQVLTGDAIPIAQYSNDGSVIVSAVQNGTGRVVYFSHETMLLDVLNGVNSRGGTQQLVINAAKWAAKMATLAGMAIIASGTSATMASQMAALIPSSTSMGLVTPSSLDSSGAHLWVVSYSPGLAFTPADINSIRTYIANGGGVLAAGTAVAWANSNPGSHATMQYPFTELLWPLGIWVTELPTAADISLEASGPNMTYNAEVAVTNLASQSAGMDAWIPELSCTVASFALERLPLRTGTTLWDTAVPSLITATGLSTMTFATPVSVTCNLHAAAMGFSKQQYDSMAPVAAHPSANTFPGWGSYTTLTSPVTVQANQPACSRSQHVMREQNAVDNRTKSQALIVRVDSALHHDKGMKCTNDALHPPMLSTPCDGDISLPYVKGVITSP
eukprot:jgi/Chrzof1/6655/Cz19g04150.t1